jgi:hypothetical protein
MKDFIAVTYWWGRDRICDNSKLKYDYKTGNELHCTPCTYEELSQKWINQMQILGIEHYIEELDDHKDYQTSISYKPTFISKCIQKFNKPVLYLDLDMKIHSYPYLFDNSFFDFMAFNWNVDIRCVDKIDFYTFETSGGIMYFNNTNNSKRLLNYWNRYMNSKKYHNKADDRVLAITFHLEKAIQWCKCYWIPLEYFVVPQFYNGLVPTDDIIISHPYQITSEKKASNNLSDRIPSNYDFLIKCKSYKGLVEFQDIYFKNKKQLSHLNNLDTLLKNKKIKHIIPTKQFNFNNQSCDDKIFKSNKALSSQECLNYLAKGYTKIQTDVTIEYNKVDIVFDKHYNVLFITFNDITIRTLLHINDFIKRKNISLILGNSYLIHP